MNVVCVRCCACVRTQESPRKPALQMHLVASGAHLPWPALAKQLFNSAHARVRKIIAKSAICNNHMMLSKLIGVWFGASVAIDVEAKVKFSAKSLDRRVGLDVGRTVFAAFHKLETLIVVGAIGTRLWVGPNESTLLAGEVTLSDAALVCAGGAFLLQLLVVAPALNRRVAAEVDEGKPLPKSSVHVYYVLLEGIKLAALLCV